MMGEFLRIYRSECKKAMLAQKADLDFTHIDKITALDLTRLASEEERASKSAQKQ